MWEPRGGYSNSVQVIASSNGTTKPVVVRKVVGSVDLGLITKAECHTWMWQPPASPIEDRGTAIPIEECDRAIPERLRLCGVIVKGLPVSLMWRKNDYVGP